MEVETKTLIKVRLESSLEDLETARELLSLKRFRAAVNRAYYAIFSLTNAVLLRRQGSEERGIKAIIRRDR
jgi:uncharacterized protein (UPF0332 family)